MWGDGLEGGKVVKVDPSTVVEVWTDTAGPSPQELLAAGHRMMNAGWFPTYYAQGPAGPSARTCAPRTRDGR